MNWIDARHLLPGTNSDWVIVRTINSDDTIFYFMAIFGKNGQWDYFDDDKDYEKTMKVTHWCEPDHVLPPTKFEDY